MLKSAGSHTLFPLIMEEWMDKLVPSSCLPGTGVASRARTGMAGDGEGEEVGAWGLWHRMISTDMAFNLVGDVSPDGAGLHVLLDTNICEDTFSLSVVPDAVMS